MIFKVITFLFILVCWELMLSNICNSTPLDDAKAIFNAPDRNQVYLDMLPNRDVKQCEQINVEFAKLNNGIPLVPEEFILQGDTNFEDLLFALTYGPQKTKRAYVNSVLLQTTKHEERDERIITEILVLEDKNKRNFTDNYNFHYPYSLYDTVVYYADDDYQHFLEQLVNRTREEKYNGPSQEEADAAALLDKERKKHNSWGDHRDQLDWLLMQKPHEFVMAVMKKYSENNHGNELRHDVLKKLKDDDENLSFGYSSLIDLIVDRNKYMATRIYDSVKNSDNDFDATLILIIVCYTKDDLKDVDAAFQAAYGKHIKDFLLEDENPSITRKILAALTDKKIQGSSPQKPSPSTDGPPTSATPSPPS